MNEKDTKTETKLYWINENKNIFFSLFVSFLNSFLSTNDLRFATEAIKKNLFINLIDHKKKSNEMHQVLNVRQCCACYNTLMPGVLVCICLTQKKKNAIEMKTKNKKCLKLQSMIHYSLILQFTVATKKKMRGKFFILLKRYILSPGPNVHSP